MSAVIGHCGCHQCLIVSYYVKKSTLLDFIQINHIKNCSDGRVGYKVHCIVCPAFSRVHHEVKYRGQFPHSEVANTVHRLYTHDVTLGGVETIYDRPTSSTIRH